ncbi:MAG: magnesium and cobalt transport protein CorA [Cohnella sp.]|jgi:hypothetical protein|uniref:magnesium and cobalt transport protein CorA n=1 Tax=Cohnella sp. TaxID=1883426 RepID=UPI000E361881|nr:magnesium and cobalt transport protein CorA [Cohnella sp.]REK65773.1 MAG: magnesium and cobalt transport protein CorA [Cohnella sp.]
MNETERTPKERLYWLLKLLKEEKIDLDNFCNEFHITFDHDTDYDDLTADEYELFSELARKAARFSDETSSKILYPNVYSTPEMIREITDRIYMRLKI